MTRRDAEASPHVAFSLAQMLAPAFTGRFLFPWLMLPAFPAELGLCLWLLVKGVDLPKWQERLGPVAG